MKNLLCFGLSVLLYLIGGNLTAQDPLFQHFYGNESSFNPAYVGGSGALSIAVKRRSQWGASSARAYRTHQVVIEDSAPCFFLDWGLVGSHNVEGEGLLETREIGGRLAFFIPVGKGERHSPTPHLGNFRLGFGFHRGQRSIDYDKLTFLDQLDPLYGLFNRDGVSNTTGFEAPANSSSPWYTTTSLGLLYRVVMDTDRADSWAFELGAAIHNWSGLASVDARQSASLLGLNNELGERYVFSASADKVLTKDKGRYWAIRPQAVYQRQAGLAYLETGATLSWSSNLNFGAFYHLAMPNELDASNTNWTSLQVEFGGALPGAKFTRFDLGLSYAIQNGGLNNFVRAPFELTAVFSFGRSLTCAALGRNDDVPYGKKGVECKRFNYSVSRRKLYDDIWYNGKASGGKTVD